MAIRSNNQLSGGHDTCLWPMREVRCDCLDDNLNGVTVRVAPIAVLVPRVIIVPSVFVLPAVAFNGRASGRTKGVVCVNVFTATTELSELSANLRTRIRD